MTGRSILACTGGAKLVDPGLIHRGRGQGGHSVESKSIKFGTVAVAGAVGIAEGGLESGEWSEGETTIGW